VAELYESPAITPDNLLLFFHHLPYTYKLHSGETVIQYVYDIHYQGAAEAAELASEWSTLKGRVPPALFSDVAARLQYQAGHAIVWRDAIVQYFLKQSGIPDAKGRAGHYPGRLEAEDARLTGYKIIEVNPWEDASGGKAVSCQPTTSQPAESIDRRRGLYQGTSLLVPQKSFNQPRALAPAAPDNCSAEWTWTGAPGRFEVAIEYFDLRGGAAKFALNVNGKPLASWTADRDLPSKQPHGDNSVRYTVRGVELKAGDVLRVEGVPDGADPAALDYVEVTAAGR
jgi:alpha-glucuronidase